MSDSSKKLRSPLAVYGPFVALVGVLGVTLAVLFSLGAQGDPSVGAGAAEKPTPSPSREELMQQMGYSEPKKVRARVEELIQKRGYSWFDLSEEEKQELTRSTRGNGRSLFEEMATKLREKEKKGK
jgi:hypothetical protein